MDAPVFCRARKTVYALDGTKTLDARMMLRVRMSRFTRHAPLQPRRIPNLDAPVVGGRHEERVVWGDGKPSDAIRVRVEVRHQRGFDAAITVVPGDEALACSVPPSDRALVHARTKVML